MMKKQGIKALGLAGLLLGAIGWSWTNEATEVPAHADLVTNRYRSYRKL
jgi:hypothetical protein